MFEEYEEKNVIIFLKNEEQGKPVVLDKVTPYWVKYIIGKDVHLTPREQVEDIKAKAEV
jgi:hypothetical protein